MSEIRKNDILYAVCVRFDDIPEGVKWYGDKEKDVLQVASRWHNRGTILKNHLHKEVIRQVEQTQECMIVITGAIIAHVFDENKEHIVSIGLTDGEMIAFYKGGHGYEVIEDNTIMYEIKAGKFVEDMDII